MLKILILLVMLAFIGVYYVYGQPEVTIVPVRLLNVTGPPAQLRMGGDFRESNLTQSDSVHFRESADTADNVTTWPSIENTTKSQANSANKYTACLFLYVGLLLSSAAYI